jgi:hypothetical protein
MPADERRAKHARDRKRHMANHGGRERERARNTFRARYAADPVFRQRQLDRHRAYYQRRKQMVATAGQEGEGG